MTWIRVDCALPRHPKVARLARTLGTSRHEAIGILIDLWTWAVDYGGDDGDLGRYSAEELVTALAIHQPEALIRVDLLDALEASGFVDRGDGDRLLLHDWLDLQGALVAQREANRERQRRYRGKTQRDTVTPVTVPVTVTSPLPNAASPLPNGATDVTNETNETKKASQPIFEFGTLDPITHSDLQKWRGLFADLDIAVEIEKMKLYLTSAPASKRPKKSLPRFGLNWLQRANADMQRASVTNQKEQARSDQLSASSEEIRQQAESRRDQMAASSEEENRERAASRREQMSKQIKALAAAKTDRRPA
jgi:hypothetical protein